MLISPLAPNSPDTISSETSPASLTRLLMVKIAMQSLAVYENGYCLAQFPISSALAGLGTEEGSYKTPTGHFAIAEKIGEGEPLYTRFISRQAQGIYTPSLSPHLEEDLILTRILWLTGLEEHNKNTYARYIYIHGTNQEDRLGTPASLGCLRLSNKDMLHLFNLVEVGTPLTIIP